MIQIICQEILLASDYMTNVTNLFKGYSKENPSGAILNGHCRTISRVLGKVESVITKLELADSRKKIEKIKADLELYPHGHNLSNVYTILQEFNFSFTSELMRINFLFTPEEKLKYFEQESLFGDAVFEKFPSARIDIKAIGNCLAADLYDAAIFHLMRTVEHGLRAIAVEYGVKKVKSGKAITEATWGDIIQAIQDRLNKLKTKRRQTKRQKDDADFYRYCLIECKLFKDHWRDDVMHTKANYNEQDALRLLGHVRDFINRLVKHGIKTQ